MRAKAFTEYFPFGGVALYGNLKFRTLLIIIPRIRGDDYASRTAKSASELVPQLEAASILLSSIDTGRQFE